jgi:hypothetical protein
MKVSCLVTPLLARLIEFGIWLVVLVGPLLLGSSMHYVSVPDTHHSTRFISKNILLLPKGRLYVEVGISGGGG